MLRVLVVDDDAGLRLSVKSVLIATGRFEVDEAFDGINALEKIYATQRLSDNSNSSNSSLNSGASSNSLNLMAAGSAGGSSINNSASRYDVIILDVDMPRLGGLETLRKIKEFDLGIIVIVMTAHATLQDAVHAVKDGAYNYLSKPVSSDDLIALVDRAVMAQSLISNIAASAPVLVDAGSKIIGNTGQMQKVFNIIHRLAKVDTPVLIRGASGTGKELVARAIHFNSSRKDEKFVAINCSAIPENLFESELFGHEKGSFTGADQRKIGKFQFAEGGTLFLDEIGDMPPLMQVKILRVLQEKVFTPVGSNREISTNVRIIAATNRPLEEMIKSNTFREDLFYRLNVVPIFLPPLGKRRDDLVNLVNIFIKKFNQLHGKKILGISADAMACLKKYEWPGNIRELENVIEHAFVLENQNVITLGSLPESLLEAVEVGLIDQDRLNSTKLAMAKNRQASVESARGANDFSRSGSSVETSEIGDDEEDDNRLHLHHEEASDPDGLDDVGDDVLGKIELSENLDFNAQKEAFEKEFIIKALKTFKGRINQTALHANIPKKTLLRKIEKYGIIAKDYSI